MLTEEEIVKTIAQRANLSEGDVLEKISSKEAELAGLVSRLGAAYIVGKELGVDLVKPVSKELKIKNIVAGMRAVNFVGKIVDIQRLREFETDSGKGAVLNVVFGDETGLIRLSLWDDRAREAVEKLQVGQVWQVLGGMTRADPFGRVEVRLGKYGNLKVADVDIKVSERLSSEKRRVAGEYKATTLDNIEDGDFIEARANLLQLSERQLIHTFCAQCRAKLDPAGISAPKICAEHESGGVEKMLVINGAIDDGYGAVSAAFFRQAAEALIGKPLAEIEKEIAKQGELGFLSTLDIVGEAYQLWGVVRRNKLNGSLELVVHKLKKLDAKEQVSSLLKVVAN